MNHFSFLSGITCERAHLLPSVIRNIERDPKFYANALLPFAVKESDKMFDAFKSVGYDFNSANPMGNGGKFSA